MMTHVPAVLTPEEVARFNQHLQQAEWIDGRATVGDQGAQVKRNQQIDTRTPLYDSLQAAVLNALNNHPLFFAAALPRSLSTPLFNRYELDQTYGFHVDGAVRHNGQNGWMRTDLSATLFLSDPDSYEGGELVIQDTYGQHSVKLPAGDLVLYPASSLHCVTPVTRGVRTASFLWIQSMVRDDKQRAMLFELDRTIQSLKSRTGESEEILSLLNLYHNLLRSWTEI
ncbi:MULTISPECIES: PKHD-type hydroxylase YbiX [Pantoea]|uniref:PKHD-type hydroxylase YbiX n=1 Tax=Pantoea brenneri TaxID=472694 RepID=A0ABU9MGZ4_9GAMM|nr:MULTISPECIES: PKHD-type hydroxylase YbiX [unclassified Pantoea]KKD33569.1 Fe(II)-dependent oxygenase [Pantoea sp. 3.5.1]MDU4126104.1 PKHD-type hydroxylase YbiX [Pantoea sp.]